METMVLVAVGDTEAVVPPIETDAEAVSIDISTKRNGVNLGQDEQRSRVD